LQRTRRSFGKEARRKKQAGLLSLVKEEADEAKK